MSFFLISRQDNSVSNVLAAVTLELELAGARARRGERDLPRLFEAFSSFRHFRNHAMTSGGPKIPDDRS